jgi:hypothetical protein
MKLPLGYENDPEIREEIFTMKRLTLLCVLAAAILAMAQGCGSDSSSTPLANPTRGYTGLTTSAVVNTTNGDALMTVAMESTDDMTGMQNTVDGVMQSAGATLSTLEAGGRTASVTNTTIGACTGSAVITVNPATMAVTAVFTDFANVCGQTLNGKFIATLTSFTSMSMAYVDFEFEGPLVHYIANGFQTVSMNGSALTLTANMTRQHLNAGFVYRVKDYVLTATDLGGETSYTLSGTIYHSAHGYVTLSTPVTVVMTNGAQNPYAGQLLLQGAGDGRVRMTFESATAYTVDVDANDGDDIYEWTLTRNW